MDLIQHTPLLTPNFLFFSFFTYTPSTIHLNRIQNLKKGLSKVQIESIYRPLQYNNHCSEKKPYRLADGNNRETDRRWFSVYSGVFSSIDIDVVIQRARTLHNCNSIAKINWIRVMHNMRDFWRCNITWNVMCCVRRQSSIACFLCKCLVQYSDWFIIYIELFLFMLLSLAVRLHIDQLLCVN
jgi:hypothetical protein